MTLRPATAGELATALGSAQVAGTRVSGFDLRALNRVIEYAPEDMTVTVEAGMTLTTLKAELARHGQWLPIDPPCPDRLSIGTLLATNASGPRRYGYGTIRDWLIGLKVVLADGRLIKSGGKVVKNVAGYDLAKVFIGSRGSLGVIVEATFKLRPLPEAERFVQARCESLKAAAARIESIVESDITPIVFDLHRLPAEDPRFSAVLVLGFAGSHEEVEWQIDEARRTGVSEPTGLDYEAEFWKGPEQPWCRSVLPSSLVDTIGRLGDISFVARVGNGVIHGRGSLPPASPTGPDKLTQRLKDEFDPRHILPEPPP